MRMQRPSPSLKGEGSGSSTNQAASSDADMMLLMRIVSQPKDQGNIQGHRRNGNSTRCAVQPAHAHAVDLGLISPNTEEDDFVTTLLLRTAAAIHIGVLLRTEHCVRSNFFIIIFRSAKGCAGSRLGLCCCTGPTCPPTCNITSIKTGHCHVHTHACAHVNAPGHSNVVAPAQQPSPVKSSQLPCS